MSFRKILGFVPQPNATCEIIDLRTILPLDKKSIGTAEYIDVSSRLYRDKEFTKIW